MKMVVIFLSVLILIACNDTKDKNLDIKESTLNVSFEVGSSNPKASVIVAFTNDPEEMWQDNEWVSVIKINMVRLSTNFSTVLLFNSKENMPYVAKIGMNYSSDYDKHMVCGYWKYPNGSTKFCYGGVKEDGNFRRCD